MNYITLNNGVKMPQLGYGVYQVSQEECERCVLDALQVGYRSIDTAQSYFNEEQVGTAIEKSRVDRKDIFLTTKVWVEHYGYKAAKASVLESLRKLRTDYLDLCLLTSRLLITTAHGTPWRSYMRQARFGPLACPIFILTASLICATLLVSNPW